MDEDLTKLAERQNEETPHAPAAAAPVVSPAAQAPNSSKLIKVIVISLAAVVGAGIVLVGIVGFLAVTGAFLFINHCQNNYQTANTATNSIEAKMKKMTINGVAPASVVGAVDYANGEDFTCSSNVPNVDATFHVTAPTVVAAEADVLRSLDAKTSGTFTIVTAAGYSASGLDRPIITDSGEDYVVRYYFPQPVPYDPPSQDCLNVMPKPEQCQDSSIIATNDLTSQPVANIRISN